MYQRWLYNDYAYLWRQQSLATRASYRAAGSRYHLTGYQYWMKHNLAKLPDIVAWWKADINTAPTTPDSSRNAYTATVFGASPATGTINGCFSFDGLNDYLDAGTGVSLELPFTVECFFKRGRLATFDALIGNFDVILGLYRGFWLILDGPTNKMHCVMGDGTVQTTPSLGLFDSTTVFYHIACTFTSAAVTLFTNGTPDSWVGAIPYADGLSPLIIARRPDNLQNPFDGLIDNIIIYNRELDQAEIIRHSERSYPLQ